MTPFYLPTCMHVYPQFATHCLQELWQQVQTSGQKASLLDSVLLVALVVHAIVSITVTLGVLVVASLLIRKIRFMKLAVPSRRQQALE